MLHYYLYIGFILMFALIYYVMGKEHLSDDLSFFDALYFSVVTQTTIGYGDITPVSRVGKTVAMIQILLFIYLIHYMFLSRN